MVNCRSYLYSIFNVNTFISRVKNTEIHLRQSGRYSRQRHLENLRTDILFKRRVKAFLLLPFFTNQHIIYTILYPYERTDNVKLHEILSTAKNHSIRRELASSDFFEGALLGNGGLGVNVCTRPDSVVLYFGHNSIWDIRIDESHKDKIGTFSEIWSKVIAAKGDVHNEEWYQKYVEDVTASYNNNIYPRPYPASALHLFFDRKEYEVLGHSLDISNGLLTIKLQNSDSKNIYVKIFVSQNSDRVFCKTVDENGCETPVFYRMHLIPHKPDGGLPDYNVLDDGFSQLLPYNGYDGTVRPNVDKGFSVRFNINGTAAQKGLNSRIFGTTNISVEISEGFFNKLKTDEPLAQCDFTEEFTSSAKSWSEYWSRSAVSLSDSFLEHVWYTNTYFIKCILNPNARCPGLFANWMYKNIGTAWHGDYHLNYNTQQVFWGLMGANRMEQHIPYLKLAEDLLPLSKSWAKSFYNLDGACFPHSAYPVPMSVMPYPSPDWGWEILKLRGPYRAFGGTIHTQEIKSFCASESIL